MNKNQEEWGVSKDGMKYLSETYPNRDTALIRGIEFYHGESFYIGLVERPIQPEDLFYVEDWIENVSAWDDYSYDFSEDWDHSTKEERDELEQEVRSLMSKWLDKHNIRPSFWLVRDAELIEPCGDK